MEFSFVFFVASLNISFLTHTAFLFIDFLLLDRPPLFFGVDKICVKLWFSESSLLAASRLQVGVNGVDLDGFVKFSKEGADEADVDGSFSPSFFFQAVKWIF